MTKLPLILTVFASAFLFLGAQETDAQVSYSDYEKCHQRCFNRRRQPILPMFQRLQRRRMVACESMCLIRHMSNSSNGHHHGGGISPWRHMHDPLGPCHTCCNQRWPRDQFLAENQLCNQACHDGSFTTCELVEPQFP